MITPGVDPQGQSLDPRKVQDHFEVSTPPSFSPFPWFYICFLDFKPFLSFFAYGMQDFYEDLFEELSKYGDLESLNICDNLADHMVCLHFIF